MSINISICKPERIRNLIDLEEIFDRLNVYRKEYTKSKNGIWVLLIQNRQLGGQINKAKGI